MRVRVSMPMAEGKRLREQVIEGAETVEDDEMDPDEWGVVCISVLLIRQLLKTRPDHVDRPCTISSH